MTTRQPHGIDNDHTLRISRVIKATARKIYQAHLDAVAVSTWRPPRGMRARVFAFDPHEGGEYQMAFDYIGEHPVPGKTSEHSDAFRGRFVELVPDKRIVEEVAFESADPAFAGIMRLTTTLTEVAGGTEVTILCENAPRGIRPSDHETGIRLTLGNLAAFVE